MYIPHPNSFIQVTKQLANVFDVKFASEREELVSVLVPVYNTEKYLRQCLDSIVNQTYKNIEIICVYDPSIDNSLHILNEYAQKDSRIIVVKNTVNVSLPQSRKIALAHSNGKYVLPVDSDDYIEESMIECLVVSAVLQNLDISACNFFVGTKNDEFVDPTKVLTGNTLSQIKYGIFGSLQIQNVWNKLVKREIYEKITFQKENFGEDCYITCQILYYADKIGYLNKPLYHYRFNEESLCHNPKFAKQRYEGIKANYGHIIEFCKEKFGDDITIFEPELSERMAYVEELNPERKNH